MGKKKNRGNPVSLFAFQDIITSITGIMILVVLLLILEIISRKTEEAIVAPIKQVEIDKLIKKQQQLEAQLNQAQRHREKRKLELKKMFEKTTQLENISKKLNGAKRQLALLEATLDKLKQQDISLNAQIQQEKHESKQLELRKKKYSSQQQQLDDTKSKIAEYKTKIKQLENTTEEMSNRVHYRLNRKENKNPILLQCSNKGIKIKKYHSSKIIRFNDDSNNYTNIIRQFQEWLSSRNHRNEYYVILIKPSSFGYVSDIILNLQLKKFEYGMEPLEESKQGVF